MRPQPHAACSFSRERGNEKRNGADRHVAHSCPPGAWERGIVFAYLAAVLAISSIHQPAFLAGLLGIVLVLAGAARWQLARRALWTVFLFNSMVSLSYALVSWQQGGFSAEYLLLLNLRVYLLTFLSFALFHHVNLFRALAFSPSLSYLLVVAASQAMLFRRLFEEFRLALRSRAIGRLASRHQRAHLSAAAGFFLDRSLHSAREISQAMQSRGFFRLVLTYFIINAIMFLSQRTPKHLFCI